MSTIKPIPEGYHTITPSIVVRDADAAIALYQRALGAEIVQCLRSPDGGVMHAEMRIGDSIFMLSNEWPELGIRAPLPDRSSSAMYVYVADTDDSHRRAVEAGLTSLQPPTTMFWGDRNARLADPFGHRWSFATRVEELTWDEIAERAANFK